MWLLSVPYLGLGVEVGHDGGPIEGDGHLVLLGHPSDRPRQLAWVELWRDHRRPASEGSLESV